ncbi:MAG: group II intron reverse transcriptase/maturase [Candidatus Sedimenticola sp. (ex Thyasira tokunagai)]
MRDTKRSELISTQLRQIAEQAIVHPDRVFTTLIHRMDVDFLREAYYRLRKDGAAGLSGVTVKDYGKELEANLVDLHARLREQRYIAPPIKRVWIEKEGGKKRPIGLLEIEDKIVQKAVAMLMGAVYEQGFYPFSHGFREAHSAHQAIGEIRSQCMEHGIRWIYDADISGFFDNIDRSWLRRFIQQRINDGGLLRLIGKWLNAGVMEGDQITYSDRGTPQGGTISPCLANIFLHHVLDDWFEREVRPRMRGHCFIVRFADDFVIGFQHEEDARRVMKVLPKRFEKYGLEIHPEKSRLLAFGKPASGKEVTRGDNTFDFLGFTHYWARTRRGYWVIKRKTARKKVRKTVQALWTWSRNNRHQDLKKQYRILCSKLRGHYQYFGVRCNMRAMETVLHHARRGWRFWLNRRSSKKALTWEKYEKLMESMPLPRPKIIHNV